MITNILSHQETIQIAYGYSKELPVYKSFICLYVYIFIFISIYLFSIFCMITGVKGIPVFFFLLESDFWGYKAKYDFVLCTINAEISSSIVRK